MFIGLSENRRSLLHAKHWGKHWPPCKLHQRQLLFLVPQGIHAYTIDSKGVRGRKSHVYFYFSHPRLMKDSVTRLRAIQVAMQPLTMVMRRYC